MRIEQLRYFVEIAHAKSISIAAENHYITQPALSRAIKLLEEELRIPLFIRTVEGVHLTSEGKELYPDALQILQDIDRFQTKAHLLSSKEKCIDYSIYLNVLTFSTLADALLLPTLEKFKVLFPRVKINVQTLKLSTFAHCPDFSTVDLIVLTNIGHILDQIILESHLHREDLFVENYFLVLHETHALVDHVNITLSDVCDYKVIVPQNGLPVENLFENLLQSQGKVTLFMQSNNTRVITKALTTQNAVLISTSLLIERDYTNDPTLKILPLQNIKGQCFALYNPDHPQLEFITHFIQIINSVRMLNH